MTVDMTKSQATCDGEDCQRTRGPWCLKCDHPVDSYNFCNSLRPKCERFDVVGFDLIGRTVTARCHGETFSRHFRAVDNVLPDAANILVFFGLDMDQALASWQSQAALDDIAAGMVELRAEATATLAEEL